MRSRGKQLHLLDRPKITESRVGWNIISTGSEEEPIPSCQNTLGGGKMTMTRETLRETRKSAKD